MVLCRFLGLWYAEVSSDRYVTKLCRVIPKLCGDGPHWAGRHECRMRGLALLLPALAPLAERPGVGDELVAAGALEHAARLLHQVPPHAAALRLSAGSLAGPWWARLPQAESGTGCRPALDDGFVIPFTS